MRPTSGTGGGRTQRQSPREQVKTERSAHCRVPWVCPSLRPEGWRESRERSRATSHQTPPPRVVTTLQPEAQTPAAICMSAFPFSQGLHVSMTLGPKEREGREEPTQRIPSWLQFVNKFFKVLPQVDPPVLKIPLFCAGRPTEPSSRQAWGFVPNNVSRSSSYFIPQGPLPLHMTPLLGAHLSLALSPTDWKGSGQSLSSCVIQATVAAAAASWRTS